MPRLPPTKTDAFWTIVNANRAPEDAELADALEALEYPFAVTIGMIAAQAPPDFRDWLVERGNARKIPYRLESVGYVAVRNPAATSGLWRVDGRRQMIYGKQELCPRDRIKAAQTLADPNRT